MTSLQGRFFVMMMQNRHLFRFQLKKEEWDFNTSIPAFRQLCEDSAKKSGKMPPGICISAVKIDGLPEGLSAEWIHPEEITSIGEHPILFYTHGGGYISGTCSDHRLFVAKVVKRSGVGALLYEYRLAPEHPFPAALEDTLVAYRWLLAQGVDPNKITIMGESAGGGLCLSTLLALRDQGLPLPAAGVALSPWTDLLRTGESYRTKADVCLAPKNMNLVCSKYYCGEHDPAEPLISPLYGDLHGLPPLYINVGDYEGMRDDSIRFAEKARAAGVEVRLRVEPGMVHCYPLMAPLFPEATLALNEICAFIKSHIG